MSQQQQQQHTHSIQTRREQACAPHKRKRRPRRPPLPLSPAEITRLSPIDLQMWQRGMAREQRRQRECREQGLDPSRESPAGWVRITVSDSGMACPTCYEELNWADLGDGAHCQLCGERLVPWSEIQRRHTRKERAS